MRILLVADIGKGPNGFYHIGDEAMLRCVYEQYRQEKPSTKLLALSRAISHQHLQLEEHMHLDLNRTPWNARLYFFKMMCKETAYRFFRMDMAADYEKSWLSFVRQADVIHFTGGGNFYSHFVPMLYYFFFIIFLGRLHGKKIIMTSQTFGPFNLIDHMFALIFLSMVDEIVIRETTKPWWKKIQPFVRPRIKGDVDGAYNLSYEVSKKVESTINLSKSDRVRIGLSLHEWKEYSEVIQKIVVKALTDLHQKRSFELVLIPHILSDDPYAWDMGYMNSLTAKLPKDLRVTRYPYKALMGDAETAPESVIKYITSKMDLVIASRYHGVVFALSTNAPVIALVTDAYYKQKNSEALKLVLGEAYSQHAVVIGKDTSESYRDLSQKTQTCLGVS